jgi:predicted lipoprotein with Yx(FWY)xxD motif
VSQPDIRPIKAGHENITTVRLRVVFFLVAAVALGGCGSDDDGTTASVPATTTTETREANEATTERDAATNGAADEPTITVRQSEFGRMLFDSKKQAIYIFQRDRKGESVCYDECAEAWPPVFSSGKPKMGDGVKASLLGTVKRRDGKLQVTYADQPLYYYAHEGPGEVRCHNVDLNGGLWWVVGPDGKRRP